MATSDLPHTVAESPARAPGGISALFSRIRRMIRRIEERRTIVKLSRMDPRLLRDMGFEPDAIYAALEGSWDEVRGSRFGD